MKIFIRQAHPQEWRTIQKLNCKVFESNLQYDPYLNLKWVFSKSAENIYKKAVSHPRGCCFIAFIDQESIGYLVGSEKCVDYRSVITAEINHIGVLPEYRSQGIGSKLVAEFRKWCKQKGFGTIYVNSYFRNQKGIEFYKKQGFQEIDISLEMRV